MSKHATLTLASEIEQINSRIKRRAIQALQCLPFNSNFYADVKMAGIDAESAFKRPHKYCQDYSKWFRSPSSMESAFRWLIKIGVLRREVDGQGLTSRVRLTPLGRQILEIAPDLSSHQVGVLERISHWLSRHWPTR